MASLISRGSWQRCHFCGRLDSWSKSGSAIHLALLSFPQPRSWQRCHFCGRLDAAEASPGSAIHLAIDILGSSDVYVVTWCVLVLDFGCMQGLAATISNAP
jgi:hypothetical protein